MPVFPGTERAPGAPDSVRCSSAEGALVCTFKDFHQPEVLIQAGSLDRKMPHVARVEPLYVQTFEIGVSDGISVW
jgi:hypothetical protein